jgi:hypothetical protein
MGDHDNGHSLAPFQIRDRLLDALSQDGIMELITDLRRALAFGTT